MTVKVLIEELQKCNPDARIQIIGEESLECEPDLWDDEKQRPAGLAREIYTEDLYSHQYYLLAVERH